MYTREAEGDATVDPPAHQLELHDLGRRVPKETAQGDRRNKEHHSPIDKTPRDPDLEDVHVMKTISHFHGNGPNKAESTPSLIPCAPCLCTSSWHTLSLATKGFFEQVCFAQHKVLR